jgi:hypothetical protein
MALTPPFNGAPKALQSMIGGNPDYLFFPGLGLQIPGQLPLIQDHGSATDLLPGYSWFLHQNTSWVRELLGRAMKEKEFHAGNAKAREFWENYSSNKSNTFNFFPSPMEICARGFKFRSEKCGMFIDNPLKEKHFSLGSDDPVMTFESMIRILKKYSMKKKTITEFFALRNESKIPWLHNPGVPTIIAYISHVQTVNHISYSRNPRMRTDAGKFAFPQSMKYTNGDGTVPTAAALIAGLKWAHEFAHPNEIENQGTTPKPVKIAEICSSFKQKKSICKLRRKGQTLLETNEYIGIPCDCQSDRRSNVKGEGCNHSAIIGDHSMLQFLGEILDVYDRRPNPLFDLLLEGELQTLVEKCPQLRLPRAEQNLLYFK